MNGKDEVGTLIARINDMGIYAYDIINIKKRIVNRLNHKTARYKTTSFLAKFNTYNDSCQV